jgi:hypothetical protein
MRSSVFLSLLAPLALASSVFAAEAEPKIDPKGLEFFEKHIRPVLSDKCYSCHSTKSGKAKAGLLVDSREALARGGGTGPAVVAGKPDESLLYKAITYQHDEMQMPPAGKLPNETIELFKQWIQMGAPDPRSEKAEEGGKPVLTGMTPKARKWWAFQPLKKVAVPDVKKFENDQELLSWTKNPIDKFLLAKMSERQLLPSPRASKETLIRRVTYDLTGLPPTTMEVTSFVKDTDPDAWEKVVDRLLQSPRYGERWGRHWLDSARYSDTRGNLEDNGRDRLEDYRFPYAWTYRDYVIKSFNEDKPYNKFIIEQLAADRLPDVKKDDPRLAALGFITVGKRFDNDDDTIDERIDTVTKATMGLTVSCARCHDHKFDPIPTADYYALHGVFNSLDEPYQKPELQFVADDPEKAQRQRVEFALKLADLELENRKSIFAILKEKSKLFRDKTEGYLMLEVTSGRDPKRGDYQREYGINPDREREMFDSLRYNPNHPVLGPFFQASRLPADNFAQKWVETMPKFMADTKKGFNPLVVETLKDLKPQSLVEVAKAYVELFARAQVESEAFFEARMTSGKTEMPVDKSMAQLLHTPFYIPHADNIATATQQYRYFTSRDGVEEPWQSAIAIDESANRLKFAAINTLRLADQGTIPGAMAINDSQNPRDSYIYVRGERFRKGPVVPRQFLEVVSGPDRKPFKEGSGRLELANAIVDPKNPLTPRVAVNRIWMHHFAEGFIPTPDDLGNMSLPPANPELLDYLSSWFVENNWSTKKLTRLILTSQAYQQSSDSRFEGEQVDPANRLLWRANMRRLDFESIRDSMLQLTGKMDNKMGGPPVNITEEPVSYRRSVYGYVDRANLSDLMTQFDFADPEMANSQRISTIVPQQALFFMNNPLPIDVARQVVARRDVAGVEGEERVKAIYQALFQRAPSADELQLGSDFIGYATQLVAQRNAGSTGKDAKDTKDPKNGKWDKKPDAKKPEAKEKPKPAMNGAMGAGSAMEMMNESEAMKAMSGNKFAALKNDGVKIDRTPLNPWEMYVQGLIFANEFVYVN